MKFLVKQTLISILLFFTISFISILIQLHPVVDIAKRGPFRIGLPLSYYYEIIDKTHFLVGWKLNYLFLDCMLIWSFVMLVSLTYRRYRS